MTDNIQLEFSKLSQEVTSGTVSVAIEIYRPEGQEDWHLEVVDEYSNSTVWDSTFATDTDALNEANRLITEQGISSFIGPEGGEDKRGWL